MPGRKADTKISSCPRYLKSKLTTIDFKRRNTMQTKTFKVPNISCGHCVHTVQNEVGELEGVKNVVAAQDTKIVTVEWEAPQTWDGIKALLEEINYPPEN
jgi:copper chaperone CopZ